MKLLSPALIAGMTHKDWQSKLGSLHIMGDLANRVPQSFMRTIPELFPSFPRHASSTPIPRCRRCVKIFSPRFACVKNAEVLGMLDLILDAIRTPQKATEDCLDKLMETTLVNSMDAWPPLAALPVILRGLRERTKELKKSGDDVREHLRARGRHARFASVHSRLVARVGKGGGALAPGRREGRYAKAKPHEGHRLDAKRRAQGGIRHRSTRHRRSRRARGRRDAGVRGGARRLGHGLGAGCAFRPFCPTISSASSRRFSRALANELESIETIANASVMAYKGLDESALLDESTKDYIVDLQGIILAFAVAVAAANQLYARTRSHVRHRRSKRYG